MKLVSFEVNTPIGRARRIGVPIDGDETGRIADLTSCYTGYLADRTDEPTPREIAAVRCPPDMIGWLKGAHKSREAAEAAVKWIETRLDGDPDPQGIDGERLVFPRSVPGLFDLSNAHVESGRAVRQNRTLVRDAALLQRQLRHDHRS